MNNGNINFIEKFFVVIILFGVILALLFPQAFTPFAPTIPYLLALIMLVIGLNVTLRKFKDVSQMKLKCLVAIIFKFATISVGAYIIAVSLNLNTLAMVGLIIVGTCPGGTASNVMSYLAKSNLALAVSLTLMTTILAPFIIPTLLYALLHKQIHVPWKSMLETSALIVLIPIIVGLTINKLISIPSKVKNVFPNIAILTITLIVATVVALNQKELINFPYKIFIAALLLNAFGYLSGYMTAKLLKMDNKSTISLMFEFSILDVGLGIVLALMFFGPEAAVAGTIYAVLQNITGPLIVSLTKVYSKPKPTSIA